jgi:hypothetical protein
MMGSRRMKPMVSTDRQSVDSDSPTRDISSLVGEAEHPRTERESFNGARPLLAGPLTDPNLRRQVIEREIQPELLTFMSV